MDINELPKFLKYGGSGARCLHILIHMLIYFWPQVMCELLGALCFSHDLRVIQECRYHKSMASQKYVINFCILLSVPEKYTYFVLGCDFLTTVLFWSPFNISFNIINIEMMFCLYLWLYNLLTAIVVLPMDCCRCVISILL